MGNLIYYMSIVILIAAILGLCAATIEKIKLDRRENDRTTKK